MLDITLYSSLHCMQKEGETKRQAPHEPPKEFVQPVFRASPYAAEMRREMRDTTTTRVLFLDEGNLCR